MDEAREELLPGSALPAQQHGALRRRHLLGHRQDLAEGVARPHRLDLERLADLPLERLVLAGQLDVLLLERVHLERLARVQDQLLVLVRLLEVAEGALVAGLHGELLVALGGDDDDLGERVLGTRGLEDRDAVGSREAQVGDHEVHRAVLAEPADGGVPGLAALHLEAVALEEHGERLAHAGLVLDDEDLGQSLLGHFVEYTLRPAKRAIRCAGGPRGRSIPSQAWSGPTPPRRGGPRSGGRWPGPCRTPSRAS